MKNLKLPVKIIAFFAMLSGIIWVGAYFTRMMISYSHFDVKMNFMASANKENLESILITITPAINTTFILYIIFIIAFTLFLILSNIKLRENGWLFIIAAIVYATFPFEVYLMTIDYKLITELNFNDIINTEYSMGLIKERFTHLSGFQLIIILSYCSMIYFLLFKPFSTVPKNEN